MTAPIDPRADRQRRLMRFLRLATVSAFLVAAAALFAPGRLGTTLGVVTVVVLVGVPLVRLAWLARRWLRKGDRRFAAVSLLLVAIICLGAALGR